MSERFHEYFAAEASEYLDQLEGLLALPGRPDLEQLLRLTRGVRGSAQMAGADTLVSVAERLEEGVRSVQESHIAWSEEIRRLAAETVADLKLLMRASGAWGPLEEARVRSAIDRWTDVQGGERVRPLNALAPEVPIESLFFDDEDAPDLQPEDETIMSDGFASMSSEPISIDSLVLDRNGALREALSLRPDVERALRAVPGAEAELAATLRELFELIELALAGGSSRE